MERHLYRSKTNSILGGVCGGLGEYFGMDPVLVRLLFVLLIFWGGAGVIAYIIAWIIIPPNPAQEAPAAFQQREEVKERVVEKAKEVGERAQEAISKGMGERPRGSILPGLVLIVLGLLFLLREFLPWPWLEFHRLWPLLLILVGVVLLLEGLRR